MFSDVRTPRVFRQGESMLVGKMRLQPWSEDDAKLAEKIPDLEAKTREAIQHLRPLFGPISDFSFPKVDALSYEIIGGIPHGYYEDIDTIVYFSECCEVFPAESALRDIGENVADFLFYKSNPAIFEESRRVIHAALPEQKKSEVDYNVASMGPPVLEDDMLFNILERVRDVSQLANPYRHLWHFALRYGALSYVKATTKERLPSQEEQNPGESAADTLYFTHDDRGRELFTEIVTATTILEAQQKIYEATGITI